MSHSDVTFHWEINSQIVFLAASIETWDRCSMQPFVAIEHEFNNRIIDPSLHFSHTHLTSIFSPDISVFIVLETFALLLSTCGHQTIFTRYAVNSSSIVMVFLHQIPVPVVFAVFCCHFISEINWRRCHNYFTCSHLNTQLVDEFWSKLWKFLTNILWNIVGINQSFAICRISHITIESLSTGIQCSKSLLNLISFLLW